MNLNDNVIDQLQQKPTLDSSFYSILDLNFLSNSNDKNSIKKAFRIKSLRYHPDKLKSTDDKEHAAQMFHVIQLAIKTLTDPILKIKYDDMLKAEAMKQSRLNDMDQARKKGRLDLEERERLAAENTKRFKSASGHSLSKKEMESLEKERIKEEGASKMVAMMQQKRQDQAKSLWIAQQLQNGAELIKKASVIDCSCRVKWTKEAGLVDETRLCNYYSKFGAIDKIIIKQGKKSATVVFKDVIGSFNAMHLYSATSTHSNTTNTNITISTNTTNAKTKTHLIPADPAFTTKLLSQQVPPAFTFLALKRDPTTVPLDASNITFTIPTSTTASSSSKGSMAGNESITGESMVGNGSIRGGSKGTFMVSEVYEKQTLDRLKEKEKMRKELKEEQDAFDE